MEHKRNRKLKIQRKEKKSDGIEKKKCKKKSQELDEKKSTRVRRKWEREKQ